MTTVSGSNSNSNNALSSIKDEGKVNPEPEERMPPAVPIMGHHDEENHNDAASGRLAPNNEKDKEEKYDDDDDRDRTERRMNDTTLPPPSAAAAAAAAATATAGGVSISRTNNSSSSPAQQQQPRLKKALQKGFGLSDWNRLTRASKDLAQRKGQPLRRDIRWKEIRQHASIHDGWTVIQNKVYFLSPYLAYHPGGATILKQILGRDGTALFDQYHCWVNVQSLIGVLLLGYLDPTPESDSENDEKDDGVTYLPTGMTHNNMSMQPPPPPRKS